MVCCLCQVLNGPRGVTVEGFWQGRRAEELLCLHAESGGALRGQARGVGAAVATLLGPEQGNDIVPPITAVHSIKTCSLLLSCTWRPGHVNKTSQIVIAANIPGPHLPGAKIWEQNFHKHCIGSCTSSDIG